MPLAVPVSKKYRARAAEPWNCNGGGGWEGGWAASNRGVRDKAIHVYPSEHYAFWMNELDLTLEAGTFGENFTTIGMTEADVCIGDVFQADQLCVQVSQPRQPCWKLSRRWRTHDFAARMMRTGRTGWYLRALVEGSVCAGASLRLVERIAPNWSISIANQIMHHRKNDTAATLSLASCPGISASWQASLTRRAVGTEPRK